MVVVEADQSLNNDSLLAIESDLVAIQEKELEALYPKSENASSVLTPSHGHLQPSMKGFMEHLAFHLWFFIPVIILLVPPQPKFIDKIVQVKETILKRSVILNLPSFLQSDFLH